MTRIFVLLVACVLMCCADCPGSVRNEPLYITMLHTTDIHGWLNGHPHELDLDATMADWQSYIEHRRALAWEGRYELLVADSGDLTEGTGFSDASLIHGYYVFPIMAMVDYDALTAGNHDLGHIDTVELMRHQFIPEWGPVGSPTVPVVGLNRYPTTNTIYKPLMDALGSDFFFETTALGTRVLYLGFIYDFTQNANNTIVVNVNDSLQQFYPAGYGVLTGRETSFHKAMTDTRVRARVDLIVVVCHVDPNSGVELDQIYTAIRNFYPLTPLALMTGHRHVLDWKYPYRASDPNCFSIESGRFFSVFGRVDFQIGCNGQMEEVNATWMETSRFAMMDDLEIEEYEDFLTPNGSLIETMLLQVEDDLDLDDKIGCAAHTYRADVPQTDPISFYTLYIDEVIPRVVFHHGANAGVSAGAKPFFITNNAAIRYNLFEGAININDLYTSFPFNDTFLATRNIYGSDLTNFLAALNAFVGQDAHAQTVRRYGRALHPFATQAQTVGDTLSGSSGVKFVWSAEAAAQIHLNDVYDIISHEYDAFTFALVLQTMQLRTHPVIERYDEARVPTSTYALYRYIDAYMPCYVPASSVPLILAYLVGAVLGLTLVGAAIVVYKRKRQRDDYGSARESIATGSDSEATSSLGRVVGGNDFGPDYVEFRDR